MISCVYVSCVVQLIEIRREKFEISYTTLTCLICTSLSKALYPSFGSFMSYLYVFLFFFEIWSWCQIFERSLLISVLISNNSVYSGRFRAWHIAHVLYIQVSIIVDGFASRKTRMNFLLVLKQFCNMTISRSHKPLYIWTFIIESCSWIKKTKKH